MPRLAAAAAEEVFAVAGIGASAGGLEAFSKLLEGLPDDAGIAYVLIPHLDPTHPSMLVDLLSAHTTMEVVQASDNMPLKRDRVHIIPPQAYLTVQSGVLRVSAPAAPHGARLPFDFFLNSLAASYGPRAVCIVLSGTGADGSLGLRAISDHDGLVIAQDPHEAAYDGMPRTAIGTGAVNLVLPLAEIPRALVRYARHPYVIGDPAMARVDGVDDTALHEIVEILRSRTARDFTHYRKATLLRRIRRRMAAAGIREVTDYISALRRDGDEIERLAKDFLIQVTSFFRDGAAFEGLAKTAVAELVQRSDDQPIRVWVPGCSTGEEAYSIAILFFEEFAAAKRAVKLQIFASDISIDALEFGRRGIYPESINADISPERLQRFFTRDDHSYRVSPELRDVIVFTDHDLLADPPFSRIDLVSCRNLLIYLEPDEQRRVLSLFHFSVHEGGYLFLGASETIGQLTEYFQPVSNTLRIFRRNGGGRPRERSFSPDIGERARALWPRATTRIGQRPPNLGDAAQRLLLEAVAPAAVLVDSSYRALYFSGPTDRYLRVVPGEPSRDALAMLREGLTSRFRAAVRQAIRSHEPVTVGGARVKRNGDVASVSISARPLPHQGEMLVLVSFADEPSPAPASVAETPAEASRVTQLEQELEEARKELESTIHELEESNQELSAINEEALSINEEFQSTNEELETSKEELQSLNEELTTTNNQLHETLERQRRTSDDLQNILNSSDAATLFLDENLNIRFFTPSVVEQFNLIASDIGRPIANLANPFPTLDLLADARAVLGTLTTIRREVKSVSGAWYTYRTSPYRTQDNRIEGVIISLSDISAIKAVEQDAQSARAFAEAIIDTVDEPLVVLDADLRIRSAGRSFYAYFDASASDTIGRLLPDSDAHHLDVPELRAFIDKIKNDDDGIQSCEIGVELGERGHRILVVTAARILDEVAGTRRILVSLNDITDYRRNEEEIGAARQAAEQANLAKSRFLAAVSHDLRQPLHRMALLHGALRDRVEAEEGVELLGRATMTVDAMTDMLDALLDIDQLETGSLRPQLVDFPINDLLEKVADESVSLASEHGLGLLVVRCGLVVRSDPRLLGQMVRNLVSNAIRYTFSGRALIGCRRRGDRLRIEVWDTGIGIAAEDIPAIFQEYRRAGGEAADKDSLGLGLAIVQRLGELLGHTVSVRSIPNKGSVFAIEVPLAQRSPGPGQGAGAGNDDAAGGSGSVQTIGRTEAPATIFVIDDDRGIRDAMREILTRAGYPVETFANGAAFLEVDRAGVRSCLVADIRMPGINGFELLARLAAAGHAPPVIVITAHGDVGTAVEAMKAGAVDFIQKPVQANELLASIDRALQRTASPSERSASSAATLLRMAGLTKREREVVDLVVAGSPNKEIAARLNIAQRTVETHRASAMKKMGAASISDLVRCVLSARGIGPSGA